MLERATIAEALFQEKETAQFTLNSIGDAVITTDVAGHMTYLNAVAERLTGWANAEANGRPLEEVVRIIDAASRAVVPSPLADAVVHDRTVGVTPDCILVRRDGKETAIEDSAAPIHDRQGRVTGAVMVFRDVGDARALSLKMAHLAQHDSLTDLPNRSLLRDRLDQAVALSYRRRTKMALLFIDLDRFKPINDELGHAAGDQVLRTVAQRLLDCVRQSDTVSRQGGDEFIVLLPEITQAQDASLAADKILAAVSAPCYHNGVEIHLTASVGIATYPDNGRDADLLCKNADTAMYSAKDQGGNRSCFFQPDMSSCTVERKSLEGGIRDAMTRGELLLHYQPKVHLDDGTIIGAEALIRWRHPVIGLVTPHQFIPIAESCGVIVPIGRWVLREACRQVRLWQDKGLPTLRIGVNVSSADLDAEDFVASVAGILQETGLHASHLELELTEAFLMRDSESIGHALHALRRMGVKIALDDFGTGYSSLSYLSRFPIDTIKIDRSFVHEMTRSADDARIVNTVIGMGSNLGMRVVAEGVETLEQLTLLRQQGCVEGHGYYFSPAVQADEFVAMLARGRAGPSEASGRPAARSVVWATGTPAMRFHR
uniref:Diguanylate cyclase phosphodiesterase n=1 Tax=uncultured bacterium 50 TaxID=1748278 RepID=A0A0U3SVK7_9BACT|nr:diguanylate cyclase phosphodiesterase [uncultured bacterium 50]